MSEKEKNIVPSTAEAEMSEEEKQKLLEQFDKEMQDEEKFGSPVLKKAYRVFAIIVTLYHLGFRIRSLHAGNIKTSFHPCRHDPDSCLHALSGYEKSEPQSDRMV